MPVDKSVFKTFLWILDLSTMPRIFGQGGVVCGAQCVDLDEAEDFSTFCPPCISPNRTALQIQMG